MPFKWGGGSVALRACRLNSSRLIDYETTLARHSVGSGRGVCDTGGRGGETSFDGGCGDKVASCGFDRAVQLTTVVYDMDCQFVKVAASSGSSFNSRRDEKIIRGYVSRRREVPEPAVLALYNDEIITAACNDTLSET